MDYKNKYLKYKEKYLEYKKKALLLKTANPLVNAAKLGQFVTRDVKQFVKKTTGLDVKEINKIKRIVQNLKYDNNPPEYPYTKKKEDDLMNVEKFLNYVKQKKEFYIELKNKEKEPEKQKLIENIINDLNFLLSKHYMCKYNQTSKVYDVEECNLRHVERDNQIYNNRIKEQDKEKERIRTRMKYGKKG